MLNKNLNTLQNKLLQSLFDALSVYRQAGHKLIQALFLQLPICSDTCLYWRSCPTSPAITKSSCWLSNNRLSSPALCQNSARHRWKLQSYSHQMFGQQNTLLLLIFIEVFHLGDDFIHLIFLFWLEIEPWW